MPKVKNTESVTVSEPVVATKSKVSKSQKTVTEPVVATPTTTNSTKKSVKKETATASVVVPPTVVPPTVVVVATPVEVTHSEPESVTQEPSPNSSSEFTDFMSKLQQLSNLVNSLKSEFRNLEKKASRELKTVAKANARRKRKNVNRAPSGFVKPTLISAELASFLGRAAGTEMARTEVTREINAYIRDNQLQDKSNGRVINADSKLSALLKIPSGEELTYFNLQRYMSPHFTKTTVHTSA